MPKLSGQIQTDLPGDGIGGASNQRDRIHLLVRQVPYGNVATYGQIAFVARLGSARIVGRAMATLSPGGDVPWHRIVNSGGRVSVRKDGGPSAEQRRLLEAEGVQFDIKGRLDFKTVGWTGPSFAWLAAHGFEVETLLTLMQDLPRRGAWSRWTL